MAQVRRTIDDMRARARREGGRCLSEEYRGPAVPLEWECAKGHRWLATPASVFFQESWCKRCARRLVTLEDMQELARQRGGACVSTKYVNIRQRMEFRCRAGHRFRMRINDVRNGHWCPDCHTGRGERIARACFEQLFGRPFPKARPRWLLSESGKPMELDGYCEPLGIAFEHQGGQHEDRYVFFRESPAKLRARMRRDRRKRRLCARHGVVLIAVPAIPRPLHPDKAGDFVASACRDAGVSLPAERAPRALDLQLVMSRRDADLLAELQDLVARRWNGQVLSKVYRGALVDHQFRCERGHVFWASPASVRHVKSNGSSRWCGQCRGTHRLDLCVLREIAAERGGECLAEAYANQHAPIRWRCSEGHEFTMRAKQARRGQWCPTCGRESARRKRLAHTIEDLRAHAAERGGRCLSPAFLGGAVPHAWECGDGHRWHARPANVLRGSWCRTCSYEERGRRLSLRSRARTAGT